MVLHSHNKSLRVLCFALIACLAFTFAPLLPGAARAKAAIQAEAAGYGVSVAADSEYGAIASGTAIITAPGSAMISDMASGSKVGFTFSGALPNEIVVSALNPSGGKIDTSWSAISGGTDMFWFTMPSSDVKIKATHKTVALSWVNKAGKELAIETWRYDGAAKTFRVNDSVLPIVRNFASDSKYAAYGGIPYSGFRGGVWMTTAATVTKGILLDDFKAYFKSKTGFALDKNAKILVGAWDRSLIKDISNIDDELRYHYPSLLTDNVLNPATRTPIPAVFSIMHKVDRYAPTSLADEDDIKNYYSVILGAAPYDDDVLRNMQGVPPSLTNSLKTDGNFVIPNLGDECNKNTNKIVLTPKYYAISAKGASIKTADGFMKASSSEKVSFTITGKDPAKVNVKITAGTANIASAYNAASKAFSFTMPMSDVTVNVTDKAAAPVVKPPNQETPKPKLSTDAFLKSLKTSKGKLSKKFSKARLTYTISLKKSVSKTKLTAKKSFAKARLQIKVAKGRYKTVSSITVKVGKGKKVTVYIKVIAEDNKTLKTYRLTVKRARK